MTAHARWMYTAVLARTESRGMHRWADHPATDPGQHHRLVLSGLDWPVARPERPTAAPTAPIAPALAVAGGGPR